MTANKMDNPNYLKDAGTELTAVTTTTSTLTTNTNGNCLPSGATDTLVSCSPEVCRAARRRYQPPDLAESPWDTKKTIFFIGTILFLVVWIIIYTILSQLKVL